MSKCKSCGAEIIWIKTANGKSMPCDPDQTTYVEAKDGKDTIITANGQVLKCILTGDMRRVTGIGYIPHWATCPSAEQHRRQS